VKQSGGRTIEAQAEAASSYWEQSIGTVYQLPAHPAEDEPPVWAKEIKLEPLRRRKAAMAVPILRRITHSMMISRLRKPIAKTTREQRRGSPLALAR
jgi:hypothetical protein